ncbi:MAG: tetratricopeptide repeat protein [Limisphaerales bacterium]
MSKLGAILWNVSSWVLFLGCIGWVLWRWLRRSAEPGRLVGKWFLTLPFLVAALLAVLFLGPFGMLLSVVCAVIFLLIWTPNLGEFLASPLTNAFDGGHEQIEPGPFYAIAQARRKRGDYLEAIAVVETQLEKFPNDYTGWMLLAEIQAENLNDSFAAQKTIEHLAGQSGHTPKNVAHAFNRLADWQLKLGQDPAAARATLERIIQVFPDSQEAHAASQRIAHLGTKEFLAEKTERPRIALPHVEGRLGLQTEMVGAQPPEETSEATAARHVEHLKAYPQDNEIRERLARLYADSYQRLDLAADQLEQLVAQPNAPPTQVVHWLNLLADLHIKMAGDVEAARRALQRVQDLFPQTVSAEKARVRMAFLNTEVKGTKKSQTLKLGSYEQNIGLNRLP